MIIRVELLHENARLPAYAHDYDSGADLYACEDVTIRPHETALVKTGVAIELVPGYEAQVRPRSGLSARGIQAAFGTVDSSYRGEVLVTLTNATGWPYTIKMGHRIAQLIVAPVQRVDWRQASGPLVSFGTRGTGGHGSTGR